MTYIVRTIQILARVYNSDLDNIDLILFFLLTLHALIQLMFNTKMYLTYLNYIHVLADYNLSAAQ